MASISGATASKAAASSGLALVREERPTAAVRRRRQGNWYRRRLSFMTSLDAEPSRTVPEELEQETNPSPDAPQAC